MIRVTWEEESSAGELLVEVRFDAERSGIFITYEHARELLAELERFFREEGHDHGGEA